MTKAKILEFPHGKVRLEVEPCEAKILHLPRRYEDDPLTAMVAAWIRMWT